MMLGGHEMVGACVPRIVTLNEHGWLLFPRASCAMQVTIVVPTLKVEPLGGWQLADTPGQLSVAVAVNVTLDLEHWPESASAMMSSEQVTLGDRSLILNWKEHGALLRPEASLAMQVTVVIPTSKEEPLGGWQLTDTPGQLSVPVTVKITLDLEQWPSSASKRTSSRGHAIVGGCVSRIVTVNEHGPLRLPAASVAMQVTVVLPTLNVEPLGGLQVAVAPGQLSATVGA